MTFMLSTEIPGARAVTALRTRAGAARRGALIALCGSIALLCCVQLLGERAPTRQETLPLAVLALIVFLLALPALAFTQLVWGARMRKVRERELQLYGTCASPRWSRLAVAGCWALTLLLGLTVPDLFDQAGLYGFADAAGSALEVVALGGCVAGVLFCLGWARDVRAAGPGDPWDPGHRRGGHALWASAALAVLALVTARAHLWEPTAIVLYLLLAASVVCPLVTRE